MFAQLKKCYILRNKGKHYVSGDIISKEDTKELKHLSWTRYDKETTILINPIKSLLNFAQ